MILGNYRHSKGTLYCVLLVAKHSETGELMAVYHKAPRPQLRNVGHLSFESLDWGIRSTSKSQGNPLLIAKHSETQEPMAVYHVGGHPRGVLGVIGLVGSPCLDVRGRGHLARR
jgi:hypothetical protein